MKRLALVLIVFALLGCERGFPTCSITIIDDSLEYAIVGFAEEITMVDDNGLGCRLKFSNGVTFYWDRDPPEWRVFQDADGGYITSFCFKFVKIEYKGP